MALGTRKILDTALVLAVGSAWRVLALGSDSSVRDIALLAIAALVALQACVVAYTGVGLVVEVGSEAKVGNSRRAIDVAVGAKVRSAEANLHYDVNAAATVVETRPPVLQVLVIALDYAVPGVHETADGLQEASDEPKSSNLAAHCVASDVYRALQPFH